MTNDDVAVTLTMMPDYVFKLGVIYIDRSVDGGPGSVCSYSHLFPVVLQLKRENILGLNVMAAVSFDLGTHVAGAQDIRQVMQLLLLAFCGCNDDDGNGNGHGDTLKA